MPAGHSTSKADVTTMAPYFARAMVAEGKRLLAAGVKPAELNRGIDLAVAATVAELDKMAGSAAGDGPDRSFRDVVAEAIEASGRQGVLAVDPRGGSWEAEKLRASINPLNDASAGTLAAHKQRRVADTLRALSSVHASLANLHGATAGEDAGIRLVLNALEEPLRQVVKHAGEESAVILERVLEGTGSFGVNTRTGEYGDLGAMGVRRCIAAWKALRRLRRRSSRQVTRPPRSAAGSACPRGRDLARTKFEQRQMRPARQNYDGHTHYFANRIFQGDSSWQTSAALIRSAA